jgi:electron transfer flavoprotein alpha subunit
MRIAVLVKQVPVPEDLRLVDGRLQRKGVAAEVNAYCRRANAKALDLAGPTGEVVVFTMGPPSAEDALREMIACGARRGVHLVDPRFAGSDTLATARVLAAGIRHEGHFDVVLCGLNSVDADTGQVGPEVARLLDLPFAPGVRELALSRRGFRARLETDDGHVDVEGPLPCVFSCAERLIAPSKAGPDERAAVSNATLRRLTAADLGLDPAFIGTPGSPTRVGPVRVEERARRRIICSSTKEAVEHLRVLGAFDRDIRRPRRLVPERHNSDGPAVWCFVEPNSAPAIPALLGGAAELAAQQAGSVTVVTPAPAPSGLGPLGADNLLVLPNAKEPEQWAEALGDAAAARLPWALLVESTRVGRSVASTVAARNGWGLIGDAIGFDICNGRLCAWKPAFGGALVALIESSSPVQMVTVRPGTFLACDRRHAADPVPEVLRQPGPARIRTLAREVTDTDRWALFAATTVVGVGSGVDPDNYPLVEKLCRALGAELAATRKVTDNNWLPRSRQVGLTGHSISPHLYVALGISGKYNHVIGVRHATLVLAINRDPDAPIFDHADVSIVGDWQPVAEELTALLS